MKELSSVAKAEPKKTAQSLRVSDPLSYLQDHLTASLVEASEATLESTAKGREFRSSGLPFCPIKTFLADPRNQNYRMNHYTSVGTALHTNIQSWLSVTKRSAKDMYGDWKCTGCGKVLTARKLPPPCSCHGKVSTTEFHRNWPKFWCYEEIAFKYKNLSGHIDLIMAPHPEFFYVVDFKTGNLTKKRSSVFWHAQQDKPSSPNYIAQIRTYCTVLDLLFDLPIKGWALCTLDRAEPIKTAADFHLVPSVWSREKSLRWVKRLDRSDANFKRLLDLDTYIENGETKKARRTMNTIIDHRPCHDEKSYQQYMGYAFFGKEVCPLKKACLSCREERIWEAINANLSQKD